MALAEADQEVDNPCTSASESSDGQQLFSLETFIFIMGYFYSALRSVGDTVVNYAGIYRVAERFTKNKGKQTTKRLKVGPNDPVRGRWINPWAHDDLQECFFSFCKYINIMSNELHLFEDSPTIEKILVSLENHLSKSEKAAYKRHYLGTPIMAHWLQYVLAEMWQIFDTIYDPKTISNLQETHPTIETSFSYPVDEQDHEMVRRVQKLLLDPAFPKVMHSLHNAFCVHDRNLKTLRFPEEFISRGVKDLEAVLQQVPAPSYLDSVDYDKSFLAVFGDNMGNDPKENPLDANKLSFPQLPQVPGTFPITPPPTPSPEPLHTRLVIDSVPEELPLQAPPSPLRSGNIRDLSDSPSRASQASPRPHRGADGHMFRSVQAFNRRHRNPERCINDVAIKSQFVTDFQPPSPLVDTSNQNAGSAISRGPQTPGGSVSRRASRRVHLDGTISSPALRDRLGLNTHRLDPSSQFHRSRQGLADIGMEASEEQHSAGLRNDRIDDTDSSNVSGDSSQERYLSWNHQTPEESNSAMQSAYFFGSPSPATLSRAHWLRKKDREDRQEKKGKQENFDLHRYFARDEEKHLREQGLELPPIGELKLSDDSRERIRVQKKLAEEHRKEREERERLAQLQKQLEQQQRKRAEILAKTGGLRPPEEKLVRPISKEWMTKVDHTLLAGAQATLAKSRDGVDIRRNEFQKLVPSTEWLNDEVVNGTLEWLDRAINLAAGVKDPKKKTRKCLAMSSLWVKTFTDKQGKGTERTLRRFGVTKENLLDVDTILVPICERMHWTILVVRPSKRTIAHMDSLNPAGSARLTGLATAWMKDILGDKYVDEDWSVVRYEAPSQNNGWDCGVHTITNGMCVALGLSPVHSYTQEEMPLQRRRIACILLNEGFNGEFDLGGL